MLTLNYESDAGSNIVLKNNSAVILSFTATGFKSWGGQRGHNIPFLSGAPQVSNKRVS